jgi:hypothetical protein
MTAPTVQTCGLNLRSHDAAEAWLEARMDLLGTGDNADVFAADPSYAIRLALVPDNFLLYAGLIARGLPNVPVAHLPRIYDIGFCADGSLVCLVERLHHLKRPDLSDEETMEKIGVPDERLAEWFYRCHPAGAGLARLGVALENALGAKFHDICDIQESFAYNVMQRADGTPVVVDPLGGNFEPQMHVHFLDAAKTIYPSLAATWPDDLDWRFAADLPAPA